MPFSSVNHSRAYLRLRFGTNRNATENENMNYHVAAHPPETSSSRKIIRVKIMANEAQRTMSIEMIGKMHFMLIGHISNEKKRKIWRIFFISKSDWSLSIRPVREWWAFFIPFANMMNRKIFAIMNQKQERRMSTSTKNAMTFFEQYSIFNENRSAYFCWQNWSLTIQRPTIEQKSTQRQSHDVVHDKEENCAWWRASEGIHKNIESRKHVDWFMKHQK